jgi:hypothetical protein
MAKTMPAAKLNLPVVEKGATYSHTLLWKGPANIGIDLTGCSAKMQVRKNIAEASVLLELSTDNSRIALPPLAGKIELLVSDEDTSALPGQGGVYDLTITHPDGRKTRLCEGRIEFREGVTRD